MRARQHGARLLTALVVVGIMLTTLVATGRADPGEEPNLKVEIVGLKSGSKRDVVVRVSNVGEQWSDKTKLTVETVSPTAGQRRTFDVPDINTVAEAPLPNSVEFTYTLAADCTNQVVKASLTAGTNYMGEKEIALDDNVVQGGACATPGQALQGPSLSAGAPIQTSPILPDPIPNGGADALDLSIELISGPRETFSVSTALPYTFKVTNNGPDMRARSLSVYVWVYGEAVIPTDQPSGSLQVWKDTFEEVFFEGPNIQEGRTYSKLGSNFGAIKSGASLELRVFVKLTEKEGSFKISGYAHGDQEMNQANNQVERTVKIVKLP